MELLPEEKDVYVMGNQNQTSGKIENSRELEFAIFCIENIAANLGVPTEKVYLVLTEKSDILYSYIVPEYVVLHTQSKEYIVRDILDVMKERGVSDMHCMSDAYLAEELMREYNGNENLKL